MTRVPDDAFRTPILEGEEPPAVWVRTSDLVPWDRNPRTNEHAIEPVMRSIREFGFGAPIVARRADRRVIAGHTRLEAARRLNLERVPVRFLDLTEEQADRLALADNRLGEYAEWDWPRLSAVLRTIDADHLPSTGFPEHELAPLLAAVWIPPAPGALPSRNPAPYTIELDAAQAEAFESALARYRATGQEDAHAGAFVAYLVGTFEP